MANEIAITLGIRGVKGALTVEPVVKSFNVDMTGTDYCAGTQSIGTEEAITIGDITTPGWCYFENLDPTNSITIVKVTGQTNGWIIAPLKAQLFYAGATGLFAFSSAGTPALKKVIYEA